MANRLLTDGLGPLCNSECAQTVTQAVWDVADALGPDPPLFDGDAGEP